MKKVSLLIVASSCFTLPTITNDITSVSSQSQQNPERIEQLEKLFIKKLADLIKTDITTAIKEQISQDKHPLLTFGQKLFEQDIINMIAKQSCSLLASLENQLKDEKNALKEDLNKTKDNTTAKPLREKIKVIKQKIKQVKKAKRFLKYANKYLDEESEEINRLLDRAMKKVNENLEGAETVIRELIGPEKTKTFKDILAQ
jgi:hypothetical protein